MTRILLHVGMPKTATTTLQYSLDAQRQKLLDAGILYPINGRLHEKSPTHHGLFLRAATDKNTIRWDIPEPSATYEDVQRKIENEISEVGATSVILSSETLWHPKNFDRAALTRIRNAFRSSEFVVLAYLRPAESHALSSYTQRVKGMMRYSGSFKEHISGLMAEGVYDYDKRLSDFAHVFGADAVKPVWLPWLKRDVLSPFREIFPELSGIETGEDRNIRPGWLYIAGKRRLNSIQGKRHLVRISNSLLKRLDRVTKKIPQFEAMMNPMDAQTKQELQKKTEAMLNILKKQYDLSETR